MFTLMGRKTFHPKHEVIKYNYNNITRQVDLYMPDIN